jgi:WD40 repeat protein
MTTRQPKPAANAPAKELGKPVTPPCQVLRVRFVTDGPTLAAAGTDGLVYRYDLSRGEPVSLPPLPSHKGWVTGLATHGEFAYSGDSWGKLLGRALVKVNSHHSWEVEDAHDGWVRMVAVSPDGATLATCGKDGFVRLWNAKDGAKLGEFGVKADVLCVAFAPDGKTVLAGDLFGVVREFEIPSGKVVRTFEVKELYRLDRIQDVGGVRCLLFDAAGKTLFVAGAEPKTGGFVQCIPVLVAFDRTTGKRLHQWKGVNDNEGYVTDLAWHPDGHVVGTASGQPGQGKVFFWKPGDEPPFFVAAKPNCHSVAVSPDGRLVAAALTNANSAGNGRPKATEYPANVSPIQFWQVTK